MRVAGVVFDFDGVVLDTEGPDFLAWSEIYEEHGAELSLDEWLSDIGTHAVFDVYGTLVERARVPVAPEASIRARKRERVAELLGGVPPLPGVVDWLETAEARGIPVGIASSSPPAWIEHHLDRLGLRHHFRCIACRDGTLPAKPDPASYRKACETLGVAPNEAIAVEDSPHGIKAAKQAGLFTVAVPHGLTEALDLSAADLLVKSLTELPLRELLSD